MATSDTCFGEMGTDRGKLLWQRYSHRNLIPAFAHRSFFFMSLPISSFQRFLQLTAIEDSFILISKRACCKIACPQNNIQNAPLKGSQNSFFWGAICLIGSAFLCKLLLHFYFATGPLFMRSCRQSLFQHLTALCIIIAYSAEVCKKCKNRMRWAACTDFLSHSAGVFEPSCRSGEPPLRYNEGSADNELRLFSKRRYRKWPIIEKY